MTRGQVLTPEGTRGEVLVTEGIKGQILAPAGTRAQDPATVLEPAETAGQFLS